MMILPFVAVTLLAVPQGGGTAGSSTGSPPADPPSSQSGMGLQLDEKGWPVLPAGRTPTSTPRSASKPASRETDARQPEAPRNRAGLALDSSLRDVFATVANPAAFRALGGMQVWWRVHLFGTRGETVGMLEITQEADLTAPDRDRLEFPDERVYGRYGATTAVRRHGMPWPSLQEQARQELEMFGMLLRLPWDFADTSRYAVLAADTVQRDGEEFVRIPIVRTRSPSGVIGPTTEPRPTDRYELWCRPGTMLPRELVYRRADAGVQRRMLLEDWREVAGVRLPWRRVTVDTEGRRTAVLEILRLQPGRSPTERDFLGR